MPHSAATLRLAYLEAMGVGVYVSRADLPGALPSTRLRCVPSATAATLPAGARETKSGRAMRARNGGPGQRLAPATGAQRQTPPTEQPASPARAVPAPAVRLALAAITAGGLLWLEDLGDNPLTKDQVALVRSMAVALGRRDADTSVQQFSWPMHDNPQLDQGAEALRMALMGFLQRHIDRGACGGVIALGASVADLLPSLPPATPLVRAPSTRQMLDDPPRKREAWLALRALRQHP